MRLRSEMTPSQASNRSRKVMSLAAVPAAARRKPGFARLSSPIWRTSVEKTVSPVGVVDLDLDDVETRGEQPEIALEPQDLIAPRQLPARQLRGIADERGVGGPDRVGERFGERDVRARLGIDESVERKTAVEPRQG